MGQPISETGCQTPSDSVRRTGYHGIRSAFCSGGENRLSGKGVPFHERIVSIAEELGLKEDEVMQECDRCLRCDHFGFGVFRGGRKTKW